MESFRGFLCLLAALGMAFAQAPTGPVIDPRGVVNAFTLQPAPSSVALGGLILINGYNLASSTVNAPGVPWPTSLGNVQVTIDGKSAPLGSVSPGAILAQVPWENTAGPADVIVQKNGVSSRPARINVIAVVPSVRSDGDSGFGPVKGKTAGNSITISASGLGRTNPRVDTGAAGPSDASAAPLNPITAFVGGMPANVTASLATDRVGEFDVKIDLPASTQPGDVLQLFAGRQPANTVTDGTLAPTNTIQYLAIPDGTPELRDLVAADLKGNYLVGNAARDDSGCWASYLFDVGKQKITPAGCLTAANRNAITPVVVPSAASVLGALVGPPTGDATTGVSSQAMIFDPTKDSPLGVTLPFAAASLVATATGDFAAVSASIPRQTVSIDAQTGAVTPVASAGGGAGGGGGAAGGGGLTIDLGNGLNHVLSAPQAVGAGLTVAVVGDDADHPKAAKLAMLNQRGEVSATKDFPGGLVPLVAPLRAPAGGGGPGAVPGAAAGPGLRVRTYLDPDQRVFYVLSAAGDGSTHGYAAFTFTNNDPVAIPFPTGWFATACTTPIPFFNLDLSRKLAVPVSTMPQTTFSNSCPASGYVLFDLNAQSASAVSMPGRDQFNAGSGGGINEINNYIYATNADPLDTDPTKRKAGDSLFVLDGVTASSFRLDLPTGVQSFAGLLQIDALNSLVSDATIRVAGDAGIIVFDLAAQTARLFPTPDGFADVTMLGVFPTTRKLAALGIKSGVTGSSFLLYDLITTDLMILANPAGVAFIGSKPRTAGQRPGQPSAPAPVILHPSPASNTIAAMGYDGDGKQVGVVVLRVP